MACCGRGAVAVPALLAAAHAPEPCSAGAAGPDRPHCRAGSSLWYRLLQCAVSREPVPGGEHDGSPGPHPELPHALACQRTGTPTCFCCCSSHEVTYSDVALGCCEACCNSTSCRDAQGEGQDLPCTYLPHHELKSVKWFYCIFTGVAICRSLIGQVQIFQDCQQ